VPDAKQSEDKWIKDILFAYFEKICNNEE